MNDNHIEEDFERRAERLGRLLFEFERNLTVGGEPLPSAALRLEQSEWYTAVGALFLSKLDSGYL